jgi:hypothetical protein
LQPPFTFATVSFLPSSTPFGEGWLALVCFHRFDHLGKDVPKHHLADVLPREGDELGGQSSIL